MKITYGRHICANNKREFNFIAGLLPLACFYLQFLEMYRLFQKLLSEARSYTRSLREGQLWKFPARNWITYSFVHSLVLLFEYVEIVCNAFTVFCLSYITKNFYRKLKRIGEIHVYIKEYQDSFSGPEIDR